MKKFIAICLSTIFTLSYANNILASDISLDKAIEIKEAKKNRIQPPQNISVDENIIIDIDEQTLNIKDSAIVYENRVYLPVRELSQALQLQLDYNSEQKITILNGGKIQLPVNENKAVVNDKIVSIDKENDKVGTIIVNDKTYLPLRFISENLGYNVSYSPSSKIVHINTNGKVNVNTSENFETEKQQVTETKLNKDEAKKLYKQVNEAIDNYKNVTIIKKYRNKLELKENSNSEVINTLIEGKVFFDIKAEPKLYINEKTILESSEEKETINQKIFYKDENLYIDQNLNDGENEKYKGYVGNKFNLQDVTVGNKILNENLIVDGKFLNYEKENKTYTFNLDKSKSNEIAAVILNELDLYEEDIEITDNINIKNISISTTVDNGNNPINYIIDFNIELNGQGTTINLSGSFMNFYENIDKTEVIIPNEDLSQYNKDINGIPS